MKIYKFLTILSIVLCISFVSANVDFVTDSWIKLILANKNYAPSPRSFHTSVLDPVHNHLVIFGGKDSKTIYDNLVFYDLVSDSWIAPSNKTGPAPSKRYGHVAVTTPFNTMYVFGGRDESTVFNDIYKFDMVKKTWIQINPIGPKPNARWGHSGVIFTIKNQFLFYGGRNQTNIHEDIVRYDFENDQWVDINVEPSEFDPPTNRYLHSCVFTLTNEMVIFGGIDAKGPTDDIHIFSAELNKWVNSTLNSTSEKINPTAGHQAIFTPLGEMLVFGGATDASLNSPTDAVWKFDFKLKKWKNLMPSGLGPDSRSGHTLTNTQFNTMMVFGGQGAANSSFMNDIHKYNIMNSVLRSNSDGVVMVVILSLVGTMVIGLCFVVDLQNEKMQIEKIETLEREATMKKDVAELRKLKKAQQDNRQPLFEKF
eukprot:gene8427-10346_t